MIPITLIAAETAREFGLAPHDIVARKPRAGAVRAREIAATLAVEVFHHPVFATGRVLGMSEQAGREAIDVTKRRSARDSDLGDRIDRVAAAARQAALSANAAALARGVDRITAALRMAPAVAGRAA